MMYCSASSMNCGIGYDMYRTCSILCNETSARRSVGFTVHTHGTRELRTRALKTRGMRAQAAVGCRCLLEGCGTVIGKLSVGMRSMIFSDT